MSSGPHIARRGICVVGAVVGICVARKKRRRGPRALARPSIESHGAGVTSGMLRVVARSCAGGPGDRHCPRPRGSTLPTGPLCRFARKSVQGAFAWWRHTCDCKIATARRPGSLARRCVAWHAALKARRSSIGAASSSRRLRRRRVKGGAPRPWSGSCEGSRACQ